MFDGFPEAGLRFLAELARNNRRDFFQPRKPLFENEVLRPMHGLVEAVNRELSRFAPAYVVEPKRAVSRIYRDTRFSKDKSPYKTELSAVFPFRGREKEEAAGFYFSVSPDGVGLVGGAYMPGTPQLSRLRQALARDGGRFRALAGHRGLVRAMGEMRGESLKRVPPGYPPDHPAADLLRRKQFYFHATLPVRSARRAGLVRELAARFRLMTPFVTWLDRTMGNRT